MVALSNVTRLYREDIHQHKLVSNEDHEVDGVVARFEAGETLTEPNYLTVQVSETEHITLEPKLLEYINHGCDPNVFFDTVGMRIIALRPIRKGEELTFFYPSTEWDMDASFRCNCGSARCLGVIQGARHLAPEVLARYRIAPHIERLLEVEGAPPGLARRGGFRR